MNYDRILAIIPARGGSKGVPGKNIKMLAGKPLIAYTIEAAKKAKNLSGIIVSTDSEEIAEISRKFGAEIPFMRPEHLAQDNSQAIDTYYYTIEKLKKDYNEIYKDFIVLQPTSPFRLPEDIDNAVKIFFEKKADSVIGLVKASHPPEWNKKLNSEGIIEDYFNLNLGAKNRQEYEQSYTPNGAIFIFNYEFLKRAGNYYSQKTYGYVMPEERSIDIDTPLDFAFAEWYLSRKNNVG